MKRLYSAMRLGEALGVTRQYVSRYVKERCPEAKIGTKIDLDNPEILSLFASKGIDPSLKITTAPERTSPLATNKTVSQSRAKSTQSKHSSRQARNEDDIGFVKSPSNMDISDHGDLTIREIAAFYGSDEEYRGWLDARKKQVEIFEREIKVKKQLGDLIEREIVTKFIISSIDGFNSQLLTDFCKSIPIDLRAAFESGKDNIEIEKLLRIKISAQLGPLTKKLSGSLND